MKQFYLLLLHPPILSVLSPSLLRYFAPTAPLSLSSKCVVSFSSLTSFISIFECSQYLYYFGSNVLPPSQTSSFMISNGSIPKVSFIPISCKITTSEFLFLLTIYPNLCLPENGRHHTKADHKQDPSINRNHN